MIRGRNTEAAASAPQPERRHFGKKVASAMTVTALMAGAGVAGASWGGYRAQGGNGSDAKLFCGGGMSSLSHVLSEDSSIFPGDPETMIEIGATVEEDGYLVEKLTVATHTGTHLDVPAHFIEGGRSVDELDATEFVWPAFVIDVRDRMETEGPDFQLSVADIRAAERTQGKIPKGALVIIQTGFEDFFGTEAYDDIFPGFSGDAVQWMFDARKIGGVGSDSFGPDAYNDLDYSATYTTLLNDGVAMPGLANVDSLNLNGDLIIAPAVRLIDGSAFQVNPIACHQSGGSSHHDDGRRDD